MLLSNLVENAWRANLDLDLGALISQIQTPPIRKLGVFEIDQFFPPADRTALAFKLNSLVASPQFAAWGEGEPLDPQSMLFTADGKPRCAIVYLAHLSEEERQFIVTLVFSKLVTWMRGQPGTPGPARARLHGRGVRLHATLGRATTEEADADDLQAGSRVRDGARALDPEPGRPRLQGDVECRNLARRATADRERQGPCARRTSLGVGRHRRLRARCGDRRTPEAAVPARLGQELHASALRLTLGDVVPPRATDEGAGGDADGGSEAGDTYGRAAGCAERCRGPGLRRAAPAAVASDRADVLRLGRRRRRQRDDRRPHRCDRRHGRVPRPRRALGAADRCGHGLATPAGVHRRTRGAALRRHRRRCRRAGGVRGDLRAARRRARPRVGAAGRLRRPRSAGARARRRSFRSSRCAGCRLEVLDRDVEVDSATPRRKAHARATAQRRALKLFSRPGETPEDFATRCQAAAAEKADARP